VLIANCSSGLETTAKFTKDYQEWNIHMQRGQEHEPITLEEIATRMIASTMGPSISRRDGVMSESNTTTEQHRLEYVEPSRRWHDHHLLTCYNA
jgi:hypothetical protein